MSTYSETAAARESILSNLPPRFEVRLLTEADIPAAVALVLYCNMFQSPVWPYIYPENKSGRIYRCMDACEYLIRHQIESGMSFGIFDTQYDYKNPESAATGGKLHWDMTDESADEEQLLAQMDFPLASVALAYDGIDPLDPAKMAPVVAQLPFFANIHHELAVRDTRDPKDWEPTAPGQVLKRNATATRRDYEGRGLMKTLALFMMEEAKGRGYRGIQIVTVSDAVYHVWGSAPAPFRSEVVCSVDSAAIEAEVDGKKVFPCQGLTQVLAQVYVHL